VIASIDVLMPIVSFTMCYQLSIITKRTWTRESDLKWMSFPDGLYIWKLFKCLKLSGEMRLNTLDCRLLLRLIYMQDCYVHHLISSCILQNLI